MRGLFLRIRFVVTKVRFWLSVIAYNLGNLWWRLVLPQSTEKWSLPNVTRSTTRLNSSIWFRIPSIYFEVRTPRPDRKDLLSYCQEIRDEWTRIVSSPNNTVIQRFLRGG